MKRSHLAAGLVVVLVASPAVATSVWAGTGQNASALQQATLEITVVNENGNPVSGAEVTVTWDGGEVTDETRSDGRTLIDVDEGADVEIHVDHDDYVRNHPVQVRDAESREVEIAVYQAAEALVTVVDADGAAVEGATVVLERRSTETTRGTTDGDGVFRSGDVEEGTYIVSAVRPGYYSAEQAISLSGTTELTLEIEEGTVNVGITVQDDHFDEPRPLEGATIEIDGFGSVTTGGSGTTSVGLDVNTRYEVTVTKDGYTTTTRTLPVGEASRDVVFTINREPSLDLEAINERVVAGERVQLEVTDEYGNPAAGATVTVDGESVGETDDEGVYRATLEEEGTHTISVDDGRVTSNEVTVEAVTPGEGASTQAPGSPTDDGQAVDDPLSFDEPGLGVKAGAAAVGVVLAFVIVRRLI